MASAGAFERLVRGSDECGATGRGHAGSWQCRSTGRPRGRRSPPAAAAPRPARAPPPDRLRSARRHAARPRGGIPSPVARTWIRNQSPTGSAISTGRAAGPPGASSAIDSSETSRCSRSTSVDLALAAAHRMRLARGAARSRCSTAPARRSACRLPGVGERPGSVRSPLPLSIRCSSVAGPSRLQGSRLGLLQQSGCCPAQAIRCSDCRSTWPGASADDGAERRHSPAGSGHRRAGG